MTADATILNPPIQYTDTATYKDWLQSGLSNIDKEQNSPMVMPFKIGLEVDPIIDFKG